LYLGNAAKHCVIYMIHVTSSNTQIPNSTPYQSSSFKLFKITPSTSYKNMCKL
jgi:hypothetical protein